MQNREAIHDPKERILKLAQVAGLPEVGARSNPRSERADIETRRITWGCKLQRQRSNPRSERADIETVIGDTITVHVRTEAIHDPKERILKPQGRLLMTQGEYEAIHDPKERILKLHYVECFGY